MRTVLKSRDFIVAAVLVLIISFFSLSVLYHSGTVNCLASTCPNLKQVTGNNGELLWDSFIRHILGSVSFR